VQAKDKKKGRLNCIHHLLSQVKYTGVAHKPIKLPPREHSPDYRREPISHKMLVPEIY
jgi:polyphosphate kinase